MCCIIVQCSIVVCFFRWCDSVMNDAAVMVIAIDNTVPSRTVCVLVGIVVG